MKSRFLICVATFCLAANFAAAQIPVSANPDLKQTLAVFDFKAAPGTKMAEYAAGIQEKINEAFVKSKRFNMVERSQLDALTKEMQIQETMADSQVAKLGNVSGAKFLVLGTISNVSGGQVTTAAAANIGKGGASYTGKDDLGFTGNVAINIKVVDVASGKILKQESIVSKSGEAGAIAGAAGALKSLGDLGNMIGSAASAGAKAGLPKSEGEAISKAIEKLDEKVMAFIDAQFPLLIDILDVKMNKKGDAWETIEVAVGKELGFEKGDVLKIVKVTEREVMGRKTTQTDLLGNAKITIVKGDLISDAKVSKGADEIMAAFTANKDQVKIMFDGSKK